MKKHILKIAVILLLNGILSTFYAQMIDGYQEGLKYINKQDMKKNVTFLASDKMKGRAVGTQENVDAARFIAQKFYQSGLIPYNDIVTAKSGRNPKKTDMKKSGEKLSPDFFDVYFQRFNLISSKLNTEATEFSVVKNSGAKTYNYSYGKDFIVDFGNNKNIDLNAPVVFLGYGIGKDGNGYNDYSKGENDSIDVKNKIVIIADGYPQESDTSSYFNKTKSTEVKSIKKKARNAFSKGALAVLVIQPPLRNQAPFVVKTEPLAKSFSRTDYDLPELKTTEDIPLIYVSRDVLTDIFLGSSKAFTEIFKSIDKQLKSRSFEFSDVSVSLHLKFNKELVPTQNVIGVMEGSDPELKKEFVVVGGHYDHVGLGYFGAMNPADAGKIHNGADDNASGTAGVIELAEAFTKVKPKRSIIFIAFSAEETGMDGSKHYAYQDPLEPLDKTVAMVNLDMLGRNNPDLVWIGGVFYSSDIKTLVEEANSNIGFELLYNVGLLTFASDQGPFIRRGIPSMFFFAGFHDDYHTPNDDVDKIDFTKSERIAKLAYQSAWLLANKSILPKYRALSMDEKVKLVKDSLERQKKYKGKDDKSSE